MGNTAWRLLRPLVFGLDPERAHRLALRAYRFGLIGGARPVDPILAQNLWGLDFASPIGLAAGFDKDAEAPDQLLASGFGFVEIGSVTPRPQPGNPRPRLFRLTEDGAVINRMGFNSQGHAAVERRLSRRSGKAAGPLGVNLGANKESTDPAADYVAGVSRLGPFADYLVVNVSSPNTPGLRALQAGDVLSALLKRVLAARDALPAGQRPPLLVKIAPDLQPTELADIAKAAMAAPVDGLICTNTTVARPAGLLSRHRAETGGLSGRPLMAPATDVLGALWRLTNGRLTLIGAGGVASAADAYAKVRAGASLVQLYSGLVYGGPGLPGAIALGLADRLRQDGFAHIGDAVGCDWR